MRRGSLAVALALLLGAAACGGSESDADRFDSQLAAKLQQALDNGKETYGMTGVSASVIVPGEGLWTGASGRDSLNGRPVSPATFFNVGSVTKTFVAALVIDLAANGVLRLDDPLARWLPRYPNSRRITLRQLLNHTSGLSDFTRNPAFWEAVRKGATSNPRLQTIEGVLSFTPAPIGKPGESWSYSNSGYLVLGRVIERATNSTVSEQLHRRLLDRHRLRDVVYPAEEPLPRRLAHGYVDADLDGDPDDVMSMLGLRAGRETIAFGWTDGGIVATARALARWGHALYNGDVLRQRWRRQMLTFRPGERGSEYGLGVARDRQTLRGTRVRIGHEGDNVGYRAELHHYPDDGVTIAVLWTDATVPFGLLEHDLAQVVLDHLNNATS